MDPKPALAGKVMTGGVVNPLRAYRVVAILARLRKGETVVSAIDGLPGGVSPAERERLLKIFAPIKGTRDYP